MICDFCSTLNPRWRYPAHTFVSPSTSVNGVVQESVGDWAACDPCHKLIDADDYGGLLQRSKDMLHEHYPKLSSRERDWLGDRIADVHREFREHRAGPAVLDLDVAL